MPGQTIPVPEGRPTFAGFPRCGDLAGLDADVAVLGVPYGVPYDMEGSTSPSSTAPAAVREESRRFARYLGHYDLDLGGELFAGRDVRAVDCGDVAMTPGRYEANNAATTAAVRTFLDRGAVPIVLGGDHAVPIPVLRAYEGHGPVCLVQIDAHLDWRDEIGGVREGLSSPMRRASEMPWIRGMAQIGLRGVGSARREEFEAATSYGSVLIRAAELHREGVEAVLDRLPAADRYYVTLDADGLDPSIAPGVGYPAFGGVTYDQAFDLFRGIAARGAVVGFDVVEIRPAVDVRGLTSLLAARLILNLLGLLAREGRIGRPVGG
ncbi:MAG: agmatinase [Chloroflexota bacterium]|nr:agmatinase [Chloroflexota bacterium]